MGWVLIFSGIILTVFACFQVYRMQLISEDSSNNTYPLKELLNKNPKDEITNSNVVKIIEKSRYLEEEFENNYQRLEVLNKKMSNLINEISSKEELLRKNINSFNVDISYLDLNKKNQESFSQLLSKNISEKEEVIPEKYIEIFKLYKDGMSANEIAEKMDIGVGEIKLIFNLYGKEVKNVEQ
ncbi:DUF6115 domain-containing protein [Natronospora cellulosivora (SeqCode)]